MDKQQLLESLDYIQIKRTHCYPEKLNAVLQRRMEDFLEKRLKKINSTITGATYGPDDLN